MTRKLIIPEHHAFVKKLAHALRHHCRVQEGDRILVAVSGGADSMALLHGLATLRSRRTWNLELVVGHVQHHLRDAGGQAELDAQFVARHARDLGLDFTRIDLDANALREAGNLEAVARYARYNALAHMAVEAQCQYIATAHHGDDQLETVLMRLLRGASVRGLAGITWRRRIHDDEFEFLEGDPDLRLIRPMLAHTRAEVEQFLRDLDQPWRKDHTNADVSRLRARLRRDVLPVLKELKPGVAERLVHHAEHMREMSRLLTNLVGNAYEELVESTSKGSLRIARGPARDELPRTALFELLQFACSDMGVPDDKLTHRALDPILTAIRDNQNHPRTFPLAAGATVTVTRDWIAIEKPTRDRKRTRSQS